MRTILLWYACPWTLSTAVVLGGALGMIAIGTVYAMLGKMVSGARIDGLETTALTLCTFALIAIFLTGGRINGRGIARDSTGWGPAIGLAACGRVHSGPPERHGAASSSGTVITARPLLPSTRSRTAL